jgi:Protein of unknown function (DUF3347)
MKPKTTTLILTLSLLMLSAQAEADMAAFDSAMSPVFAQYESIHKALSGDTTNGVAGAAKKIAKLAVKVNPKSVQGKHAAHYKHLPMKIKAAAVKLSKAKGIAKQREAFMELSRPLAMWATMSKPAGINVVFCSMAKGSWLQRDKKIANPYYGAKMLRCGEVVSGKHKGTAGGHMKSGHSH